MEMGKWPHICKGGGMDIAQSDIINMMSNAVNLPRVPINGAAESVYAKVPNRTHKLLGSSTWVYSLALHLLGGLAHC